MGLDNHTNDAAAMLVQTARQNFEGHTWEEAKRVIEACKLQYRTGHTSEAVLKAEVSRKPDKSTLSTDK